MKNLRTLFFIISITLFSCLNAQYRVTVYSASATQSHIGEGLGSAIDGLMNTIYQSDYNLGSTLPDTLDFKFVNVSRIDSMIYYPRTDNTNGDFGSITTYWASKDNPTVFTKLSDTNFGMSSASRKIALNGAIGLINPYIVRIVVRTGKNGYAACAEMVFKSTVQPANPPAECDPMTTTVIAPDTKLTITAATASNYQPGTSGEGPITYSFDGDYSTFYHSNWSGGGFPITLSYNLASVDKVDYLIYHPRPGGGAGSFQEGEVWYSQRTKPTTYIKVCDFNFGGSSYNSKITFPSPLINPWSVKIIVKSGVDNFASCAEMEFYKITDPMTIPTGIFANAICSELQSGVTQATIDAMSDGFYKSLAQCLLNGTYHKKFRVQSFEPYPTLATTQNQLKVSSYYSSYENPTGIFFNDNTNIIVFVENTFGQSISLKIADYDARTDTKYALQTGINKIKTVKGLSYIDYYTDNYATLQPVKIHIVGGIENGYYDLQTNNLTTEEWQNCMLYSPSTMFNLRGKYINMLFRATGLKQYSPDGPKKLVEAYDTIVKLQFIQMGLFKYNKVPKNRMQAEATDTDGSWNGGAGRAHYGGALDATCDANRASTDVWGLSHELGHCNQIIKWVSLGEVTNNIYSVWATYVLKTKPENKKLETEDHNDAYYDGIELGSNCGKGNQFVGARFNAYLNNGVVKGEQWLCQFGPDALCNAPSDWQYGNGDHFVKLCPLWQLELYNQAVHPEKFNWFGDLCEQIRLDANSDTYSQGQRQINFIKNTCDVTGLDLTDFFRKSRMLTTYDKFMNDYGSAQLTITDADTTAVVAYIRDKGYPKPECPVLYYLSANSVDAVKNKRPLEGIFGMGIQAFLNYTISDSYRRYLVVDHAVWKNALVFETYSGRTLTRVSMVGGGFLNNDKTRVYYPEGSTSVYAVGWDGTRKLVFGEQIAGNEHDIIINETSISPNPCKESFTIKGLGETASLKITDLSGKTVMSVSAQDNSKINVSNLTPGCYFVRIETSKETKTNKLIIK